MVAPAVMPIPSDGWGAVERVIWETTQELRRRGHKVHILNSMALKDKVLAALRFPQVVQVHWEYFLPRWVQFGRLTGARVVSTSHSGPYLERVANRGEEFDLLALVGEHWALSPQYAERLAEYFPQARVERIRNGVAVERFRHGVPGNGRAILLAMWRDLKGQERAWKLLGEAGVPCDFVGPGAPYEPGYQEGSCRYLGTWTQGDVEQRLCEYSALLLPSLVESAEPLVVLEAQAAGIPVVISPDIRPNFDVLRPGMSVAALDDGFAAAVTAAIGERDALGATIRANAERELSWVAVADRFEELVLGRRR